jgi:hypothetical protein
VARDLGIEWFAAPNDVAAQVDDFLSREMRHHVSTGEELDARADIPQSLKDVFQWAQDACSGRPGDVETLDRIRDALRLTDMTFLPFLAASEANLAEQAQTAIMLDRQIARRNEAAGGQPGLIPDLVGESRELRPIILDVVAHFGRANQALAHALNLAGVARTDLIWPLEAARKSAAGLLAERDAYVRQVGELRGEVADLERRVQQAEALAVNLQAVRATLCETVRQRDVLQPLFRRQTAANVNVPVDKWARERLQERVDELKQENDLLHARNVKIARVTRYIPAPVRYLLRRLVFRSVL